MTSRLRRKRVSNWALGLWRTSQINPLFTSFMTIIILIHMPIWFICWHQRCIISPRIINRFLWVAQPFFLLLNKTAACIIWPNYIGSTNEKLTFVSLKVCVCVCVPPAAGQAACSNPGNNLHWGSQRRRQPALVSTHRSNIMKRLEFCILFVNRTCLL